MRIKLSGANLSKMNLKGRNFDDGDLAGANFNGANLERATFNNCNLTRTEFLGANLKDASFKNANLNGAIFFDAKVKGADFSGADLRNSAWHDKAMTESVRKALQASYGIPQETELESYTPEVETDWLDVLLAVLGFVFSWLYGAIVWVILSISNRFNPQKNEAAPPKESTPEQAVEEPIDNSESDQITETTADQSLKDVDPPTETEAEGSHEVPPALMSKKG